MPDGGPQVASTQARWPVGPVLSGLYGFDGADPQTLRWPRKEGPSRGPEDADIPPPWKRRGLVGVLLLLLFLLDGLTLLQPGRDPPWFETIGRPGCF